MTHELKTWPDAFEAIWDGRKKAEFRKNDRDFAVGDILVLMEWDPETGISSGRQVRARVTDMRAGPRFGIPEGYAMLSLDEVARWGPSPLLEIFQDRRRP